MPINWIDTKELSFNSLLLLERVQISWLPEWLPDRELAVALKVNPAVEWFLRHKCPDVKDWLDKVSLIDVGTPGKDEIYLAERKILGRMNDLLTYAMDPSIYDSQPFLGWDSEKLLEITDFRDKIVIDVGAGTGRLTFIIASLAKVIFAVEPVENLRRYMKKKAYKKGCSNFYTVDGIVTEIPFPGEFADITMGGHVFGDHPEKEIAEMERVTKTGGTIILCPGNNDKEDKPHRVLENRGYKWSRFEEPEDGMKRKYWKIVTIHR